CSSIVGGESKDPVKQPSKENRTTAEGTAEDNNQEDELEFTIREN
ncbi:hypothetical protein F442_22684, partial [Phytophthora nicotianae P10297]